MFAVILSLLDTGLKLWLDKRRTRFIDEKIRLEKAYYEEYNKPDGERSNAVLDNLHAELCRLAIAFATEAGTPSA